MADYTTARGASFLVLNWDVDDGGSGQCGPRPLDGLGIRVIRLAEDAPEGWSGWTLPNDLHPDARATRYAAEVLSKTIRALD
jgi:hypothetical protein